MIDIVSIKYIYLYKIVYNILYTYLVDNEIIYIIN